MYEVWGLSDFCQDTAKTVILHNRQHNVMKFSQYDEIRGGTKRFIITSILFWSMTLFCVAHSTLDRAEIERVKEIKGKMNRRFGAMGWQVNFDCNDQTWGWMVVLKMLLSICWRQASCQHMNKTSRASCVCVCRCINTCVSLPCVYPVLWAATLALFSYSRHAPPPTQFC